jgi:hypothetical protein
LTENGVFVQWLQAYGVSDQTVFAVLASLRAVFPHVEVWEPAVGGDLVLVGSLRPLEHDAPRLAERMTQQPFADAFQRIWRVDGLEGLYSAFVADHEAVSAMLAQRNQALNTDDHPIVEFGFARHVGRKDGFRVAAMRAAAADLGGGLPASIQGTLQPERLRELRAIRALAEGKFGDVPTWATGDVRLRCEARAAFVQGGMPAVVAAWQQQAQPPTNPMDLLMVAEATASVGGAGWEPLAARLAPVQPVESALVAAAGLTARGEDNRARQRLLAGIQGAQQDPWTHNPTLVRGLELGLRLAVGDTHWGERFFDTLEHPFAAHVIEQKRAEILLRLGAQLDWPRLCVRALAPLEPHVPWQAAVLGARARCYAGANDPRASAAAADLIRFERAG